MPASRNSTVSWSALIAIGALGLTACQSSVVTPCTALQPVAGIAAPARFHDSVTLHIDYEGAEVMLAAFEHSDLSDAAVDSLFAVRGARAMVDNVTRYFPELGHAQFRAALQRFGRDGRIAPEHAPFNLRRAHSERGRIRSLVQLIRANEDALLGGALATLSLYRPDSGPLQLTAYPRIVGRFAPDTERLLGAGG